VFALGSALAGIGGFTIAVGLATSEFGVGIALVVAGIIEVGVGLGVGGFAAYELESYSHCWDWLGNLLNPPAPTGGGGSW
jgi:hypothetical protein